MTMEQTNQYGESSANFEIEAYNNRQQIFTSCKKHYSGRLLEAEWKQALLYYKLTLYWKMKQNSPNHEPFYDNKKFRYYEYGNN